MLLWYCKEHLSSVGVCSNDNNKQQTLEGVLAKVTTHLETRRPGFVRQTCIGVGPNKLTQEGVEPLNLLYGYKEVGVLIKSVLATAA